MFKIVHDIGAEPASVPLTEQEQQAYEADLAYVHVPKTVSMRQARLALLQSGLLAQVDQAIQQGGDADKIAWEYATEVRRDDPLVQNLSAALSLTEAQLDALFTLAASL